MSHIVNPDPRSHALADAQRLTAERPECKRAVCGYFDDLQAARAELAAANAELDRLAALKGRVDELAEYAERAQVAEATLDRVTALADEQVDEMGVPYPWAKLLRAALTPALHHVCAECPECLHDGNKCCGCYDNACCRRAALTPEGTE